MKKIVAFLLAGCLALSLTACGAPKTETLDIFAMDTYMSLVAIGAPLLSQTCFGLLPRSLRDGSR